MSNSTSLVPLAKPSAWEDCMRRRQMPGWGFFLLSRRSIAWRAFLALELGVYLSTVYVSY
jgi:hypothetical protein